MLLFFLLSIHSIKYSTNGAININILSNFENTPSSMLHGLTFSKCYNLITDKNVLQL
jgi:hypothetical protein